MKNYKTVYQIKMFKIKFYAFLSIFFNNIFMFCNFNIFLYFFMSSKKKNLLLKITLNVRIVLGFGNIRNEGIITIIIFIFVSRVK